MADPSNAQIVGQFFDALGAFDDACDVYLSHMIQDARRRGMSTPQLLKILYWNQREVPIEQIESAFDLSREEILAMVRPCKLSMYCEACRTEIPIAVDDRTEIAFFRRVTLFCPACSWKRRREDDAARARNDAARELRKTELATMPYADYLKTEEWQKVRADALERAGYRCQVCNKSRDETILDTHHRTYERRGDELPDDVTVLCRDCHDTFHEHRQIVRLSS